MPSKKSQHEVVAALQERYGTAYDYSKIEYINARTPIIIACESHGDFLATSDSLLSKKRKRTACPKCSIAMAGAEKRMTTDVFIQRAKQEIKQNLDYSKVTLKRADERVAIICPHHGEFSAVASNFLYKKTGCPKCNLEERDNKKRFSKIAFENRVKKFHGNKYKYNFFEYTNQSSKLNVKCPLHGNFEIAAGNFLAGKGCQKCGIKTAANKRKISTREWIGRAIAVHGDKFDYSKSIYKGAHKYITIICSIHGEFEQKAGNHVTLKRGCRKCAGIKNIVNNNSKILSQREFIARCEKMHKGSSLSFKKIKYVGTKYKVKVECEFHGELNILAGNLMRGSGCSQCAIDNRSEKLRTPIEEFVKRASEANDFSYDYSLVSFKNLHEKVVVICPMHGAWEVIASNHIIGKSGCPTCQSLKFVENARQINTLSTEDFIELSIRAHGYRYDYSNTRYSHSNSKVTIECEKHGEFTQTARLHIVGKGCPKCANEYKSEIASTDSGVMLSRFREIHGDRYKYSLPKKIKYNDKIDIECKQHGHFKQVVRSHLEQKGCPKCSLSKGENTIALWLERNGFDFEVQFPIDDAENNRTLRFDFYIAELKMLIEYDGQQHFFPVNFGGMSDDKAQQVHRMTKERDAFKDNWAKVNKKNLLRITYLEDVGEVLNKYLSPYLNTSTT